MDLTTQPVLCCIGPSVAGKPTQFLMERALTADQLDWRVLTVQVQNEELDAAIAGMKAMKFMAVRFFPSIVERAAHALCPNDPTIRFMGGVTSAMRSEDGWSAWHNRGPAIMGRVKQLSGWPNAACWLHGSSELTRSLFVSLIENLPALVLWSDAPNEIPAELIGRSSVHVCKSEIDASEALQNFTQLHHGSTLVVAGSESGSVGLDTALLDEFSKIILVADSEPAPNGSWKMSVAGSDLAVVVISVGEQLLLSDAFDYQRWTGRKVDVALLRDALDEFSDF